MAAWKTEEHLIDMSVDTTQFQNQDPISTPERLMLGEVRRRLIGIHYSLEEATNDDRDARVWALREMMALIRDLAPYREKQRQTPDPE